MEQYEIGLTLPSITRDLFYVVPFILFFKCIEVFGNVGEIMIELLLLSVLLYLIYLEINDE
jgi:hypothetical protein